MNNYNWASRPSKKEVREFQLSGTARKRGIFLPGWDNGANDGCLCIQRAMSIGSITQDTEIIAVERNAEIAPKIEAKLYELGLNYRMHVGPLATLNLGNEGIDFAFFDFLGCLDAPTAAWMSDILQPRLVAGADLSFTFAYAFRANGFMKACGKAFKTLYPENSRSADTHYQIDDWTILLYVMILKSVFSNYQFEYRMAQKYKDNVCSMVAYRMEKFEPLKQDWPTLVDLCRVPVIKIGRRPLLIQSSPALSPAQKAWITRRAQSKEKMDN